MTLRIAVLAKQVPVPEALALGPDGRLLRGGRPLEMNAFCRRAVSMGISLARETAGECQVVTLGPPEAVSVLREALVCGADSGVHICGPEFAGSDTLATARALAAALRVSGPFDVVLLGRNSIDSDTGQVGPALAELLDLPFVASVQRLEVTSGWARCESRLDDGWVSVDALLPAVVSCAERLCQPCKAVIPADTSALDRRIQTVGGEDLGKGPWGFGASRTVVGTVRAVSVARERRRLSGTAGEQVRSLVDSLRLRQVIPLGAETAFEDAGLGRHRQVAEGGFEAAFSDGRKESVAVVVEPGRMRSAREMLGAAAGLAAQLGGKVTALVPGRPVDGRLALWGADEILVVDGWEAPEDFAHALVRWASSCQPWAVLAPSTVWGREVAARAATGMDSGLTGDAVELQYEAGRLVAWKTALSGAALVAITATSATQLATVRPGVLPLLPPRHASAGVRTLRAPARRRTKSSNVHRDFDLEALLSARVVVGVGLGVAGDRYHELSPLLDLLGAELACTRRVADQGWLPRGRQVGLTGITIRPDLYLALGASGSPNHMVGVRAAHCVVAVNRDESAEIFGAADFGLVGDWPEVVSELVAAWKRVLPSSLEGIPQG